MDIQYYHGSKKIKKQKIAEKLLSIHVISYIYRAKGFRGVRTLRERIGSALFERTTISKNDFAFLARQKRITIDGEDYYIDLLFYHRKMKRLVVIEFKLDKFRPEYKGQVEL